MRVIGIMPSKEEVGMLMDSLKVSGFEREDMIVSDMEKSFTQRGADDDKSNIKTERDELMSREPYTDLLKDKAHMGIIVSVEASKHQMDRVRTLMKENGALYIIEDGPKKHKIVE